MSTCIAAAPSSQLASSSRSGSALPSRKPRIRGPIDPGHTPQQDAASTTTLTIIPSPRPFLAYSGRSPITRTPAGPGLGLAFVWPGQLGVAPGSVQDSSSWVRA